ncbi:hypothetical protein G6329_17145 [Vibrio cholerae]|uniref:DUF6414 family protein n=3 Tax=Vibrio cholerae TaxID=666 RepID=UPI0011DB242C|nr:hypothetical protein [Vibrio cholerae]HAS6083231.1 hypothetical protein [Vibrio vulnificus]EJB5293698.1 hypothetical protein [Vibrio cholerae]EKF9756974.1 hypothetical protein [Vibrio cholerae]ELJ8487405.1 hypothetical protein [Vibrio cholerae]TXY24025.1 hypothetical protein FXE90_09020 [Vibrio cholerae]
MEKILEPVFLNEKMMLNTAAYLFKGVELHNEVTKTEAVKKSGSAELGFSFLQTLISPVKLSGDMSKENSTSMKSARIYTLGGLHMSVVNTLYEKELLKDVIFSPLSVPEKNFVGLNVVLKPVDFYQILEVIKLLKPLIFQLISDFGSKLSGSFFNKKVMAEIPKYDKLFESLVSSLENDYLTSKQLEMLMLDPSNNKIVGIVDIDLTDVGHQEIKAKLNDGEFYVIGKVSRHIEEGESMSMLQRSMLSKIMELMGKVVSLTEGTNYSSYQRAIEELRPTVEEFIQINLPGPAVRVIAMSVNV